MNTQRVDEENTLEQILTNTDTRCEWIQFQLAMVGSSFAEISRLTGLTRQGVGQVARGKFHNVQVEKAIAEKIGMDAARIWPERYQYQINTAQARG